MTNLQACQSFRRPVSPKTGILGIKKSAPWNKRKQTVSSDASPTQQTPSKSSICALYLATLIPQIGLLSVQYRTNRRMTPINNNWHSVAELLDETRRLWRSISCRSTINSLLGRQARPLLPVSSGNGNLRTLRSAVSWSNRVRRHLMRNAEPLAQSSGSPVPAFP